MAEEQTQGTTQSSQGTQGQSTSSAAGGTEASTQGSTASQTTSTQTGQTQQQAAPSRPDWLPETFFDPQKGPKWDDFGKHFGEVVTRDAAEQSRRLALPQKPEEYKVGTTAAFKPPEGIEFKIDEADPLWSQARSWAHKYGLTQDAFNEGIDLFAGARVGDAATTKAAYTAEIAKLGATGPARVTELERFYTGFYGSAEDAKAEVSRIFTAADALRHEKKMAKWVSQGAAAFSQAHREPGSNTNKPTEEQWGKMTPAQRMDYTNNTNQSQFKAA